MKKAIFAAVMLAVSIGSSQAQDKPKPKLYTLASPFDRYTHYLATFRFAAATPIGSFSSGYIDKTSFRNFSASMEWVLQSPISIGGEIGSSYFEKRIPRTVVEDNGQTISAVQTRTLSQYPIQGFVNYRLAPRNAMIQPYVQVSAGVSIVDFTNYYGSLADQQQKASFTYGVGAGSKFLFKKDGSWGADVRVKYAATTFKYDLVDNGISSINTSIGIFYRWW